MTFSDRIGVVLFGVSAAVLCAHLTAAQEPGSQPAVSSAIASGRTTFRQFCGPCHGVSAKGDGPVGRLLLTKPADLTQLRRRHQDEFPRTILEQMLLLGTRMETEAHGSEQMPIWGPVFRNIDTNESVVKERVANLLAYLESIQE